MKKKPIGYGKKDRDEMKALIERTEPKSGDYVGSGTVTEEPKKKKKMKRMQMGGMAGTVPMVMPANLDALRRRNMAAPMPRLGMMADRRMMRGGGLARKGVGMAMAKGGLVKANGCAQRGKTKGKMV